VRRHFATVHRFFRGRVTETAADDLTQRSFLVALERHQRFRIDGSMRAFLLGIARLELLVHYRDQRKSAGVLDPDRDPLPDVATGAAQLLERRDDRRMLARALRRLPLDLQIAVELHYWEQLSSFEIAEVLDVPAPTVRSRLQRARKLLEELLVEVDGTPAERTESFATLSAWARDARALAERDE
jgi:RNA polymerase sigma factor (sigma-70 family)